MSTPLWRQILEGTFDPFSSSFDRRRSGPTGLEGLQTDWRAFQIEESATRAREQERERAEREALELQGQEYVNLSNAQANLERATQVASAFGQPDIQPSGPPPALEGIANVLDALKSGVVGGLSGLMGWDIQGDDADQTKFAVSRFTRQEDIIGNRNRAAVAWERALKGLLGGQSYGFGDFEALRYTDEDPRSKRLAQGAAAFALDVAFDPLTYFSFGSSILGRLVASTGVRVATKKVAAEALQKAGDQAVRNQVERLSVRELAQRVADATGQDFGQLILRTPQQLADDLARTPAAFLDAAADSWSFGNAAAYGARGRTGLYDRLVETVGRDIAEDVWKGLPGDIRGGVRFRVPFHRTVSEETGLRLPTVIQFPGSAPGRGFDLVGMGHVTRKMNEARLIMRTGPFKFLENVSGKRGRSWTNVLNAARRGDGEAIEAYAIHFGTMAIDDVARRFAMQYDQIASAGMHSIARKLIAATERGLDQDEILQHLSELYFKRGRADIPPPSRPEHIIAIDMSEQLFEMTDNVHRIAVEIYGEDAATKMADYATRMLTEDGFQDLVDRYGRLEGRRGRLSGGAGRDNSSYPKTMALDDQGRLIVTEWMTPDEIFNKTGKELFITDPVEAVGEYLIMMRRELMRDWTLKHLDEMGLLKSLGEDVIRQPVVRKIQSEAEVRMRKIRDILNRIEKGEKVTELDDALLDAERSAMRTINQASQLVEVEPGVFRSNDGMVEVRRNRQGGWSATVEGEVVIRPTVSQLQAEGLVPELQGPVREVDWDEVRRGFYDEDGNRIPARQVRMEGTDDPRWVTSAEPTPAASRTVGPSVAPDADDSRQISGTWEPWLASGSEVDLEYVHKVLRHRVAVFESGGRSVNRRAYNIHKRDLEILEELHPHLKGINYDAPVPASSVAPDAKYRVEVGPAGEWVMVENDISGIRIKTINRDTVTMTNGAKYQIVYEPDLDDYAAVTVDPAGRVVTALRGTSREDVLDKLIARFGEVGEPGVSTPSTRAALREGRAPVELPDWAPARVKTREEILEEVGDVTLSWSKVGQDHVAYYEDSAGQVFEIIITKLPKGSKSNYEIKVIPPDGRSSAAREGATTLENTKNLALKSSLVPEIEKFGLRLRERGVRSAIGDTGEWPDLSVVEGSFVKHSSTTKLATVDFGDGSSLDLVWNGGIWVASRKINGRGFGEPPFYGSSEWDEFVQSLNEMYPGIRRVLDEQLPGRPVGESGGVVSFVDAPPPARAGAGVTPAAASAEAVTSLPATSVDEWLAGKIQFTPLRRVALNVDESIASYGDFDIRIRKRTEPDKESVYSVSIHRTAEAYDVARVEVPISVSSDEDALESAARLFRDFYQRQLNEGYVDPVWSLEAPISRARIQEELFEKFAKDSDQWQQVDGIWKAEWNGYTFEIIPLPGDSNWAGRIIGRNGQVVSEDRYKTGFREARSLFVRDMQNHLNSLDLGEIADIVGVSSRQAAAAVDGPPVSNLLMREEVDSIIEMLSRRPRADHRGQALGPEAVSLTDPSIRAALRDSFRQIAEEFNRAVASGDPAALQGVVESIDRINLAIYDRFDTLLRIFDGYENFLAASVRKERIPDVDYDRVAREIKELLDFAKRFRSEISGVASGSDIPGFTTGARGVLGQRYYDLTNVYDDRTKTRVFAMFEPPSEWAEEYNQIVSTVADVMRRASAGESPDLWSEDLRAAIAVALDLADMDPLAGFASLQWRGRSEVLVPEFNLARSFLGAAEDLIENSHRTDLLRSFSRIMLTSDEIVPAPAPRAVPQVPSAPDRPFWELTLEEFEASGRTLYHGTPQEFDLFDSASATYRGRGQFPSATGRRFYFTDNPEVAGDFRQNSRTFDIYEWLDNTDFSLEDLEDPEIFAFFWEDVNRTLLRRKAKLQQLDEDGVWVDMDPGSLTFQTIEQEIPIRALSERGQVIETRVFGREIDLTGDLSGLPEELLEALRLDGILDFTSGRPSIVGYQFRHEKSFDNAVAWMRENGYGRAVVPDAQESGGRSYIALEEYIEYGRSVADIYESLTGGVRAAPAKVDVPPPSAPPVIEPGLRREYAGRYKYTNTQGEQFTVEQVRPDGKAQVWRVTDNQGIDIGEFPRREDAVAFLEGRPAAPPRQQVAPEAVSLVREMKGAMDDLARLVRDVEFADDEGLSSAVSRLQEYFNPIVEYLASGFEILAFDNPALARRLLASIPEVSSGTDSWSMRSDLAIFFSDIIEDVATKAPRATDPSTLPPNVGTQVGFDVIPGVGGAPNLSTPAPRSDFIDRDDALYWANRTANRLRNPQAKVVRDEVWETNRADIIKRLEEDYTWLEAALNDGNLLQNMNDEQFDTWVERVITFLQGVDPSIDPFKEVIDKGRYARAAREAGLERFKLGGIDPVVAAIIKENDLFGPEILVETIRRHFALSKDLEGAEKFYQNFWRPYYTASKSWMTQGRGYGYTTRNIIGSMYNAWLADVGARHFNHSAAMLAARRKARESADEILERRGVQQGETTVEAWERIFDGELRRHLKEGYGGFRPMEDRVANLIADAYQAFTERNYGGRTARSRTWGDLLDRGTFDLPVYETGDVGRRAAELFPGRSVDELTRAQRIGNMSVDNPWMRHVTRVNESAEDYLRFAAFLRGVDTYGLDDGGFAAGSWVIGTQFDYSNLSDFERRVMKNIIPFYTWTRYNVPLQIRSLWMEPGKVNRLLRFHEEVVKAWTGEDKEQQTALPEWLRRRGGWMTTLSSPMTDPETMLGRIFGLKEDPIAAFIESPLSDLGMLFNATLNPLQMVNMKEVINNLNPILGRTVYEGLTGRSYTSGRELDSDAVAPRWAVPYAWARGRTNEEGDYVFSQKWAQFFRNMLPPFAQAERLLAPMFGDERMRRRWLTTMGSQILAAPLYTVDPNQQAFAINNYARGINEAVRAGVLNYEDKRDVATRLLQRGFTPEQIRTLGLSDLDPSTLNFEELDRARRNVNTEEQLSRFLESMPPEVAEQFIFRRGFRGLTGGEAVQAWQNRQPIDTFGALLLPEIDAAFSDWFGRLSEAEKLGFVFQYGYGPYRGAQAVREWSTKGGLPNRPPGLGSADFLS